MEHPSSDAELGRRIADVVSRIGGRQKASEIAQRSGDQLWKYTRGTAEPPFMPLVRLCGAAGVRLDWLATGEGPMLASETAPQSESPALRRDDLMLALQLAEEALQGRTLPSDKRAELVTLIYELLEEGLPEAKVLRFARAAAA